MIMEVPNVKINHILYATDFSENAKHALSYAKSIAEQYNAEVTLLHVIKDEVPGFLIFDAGMDRTSKEVADRLKQQKELFEKQKTDIISKIRNNYNEEIGIKEIKVERGHPVKIIANFAEKENYDLIVMGSKGRNTLEGFLLGDTVRQVITRVKIPVLVVQ